MSRSHFYSLWRFKVFKDILRSWNVFQYSVIVLFYMYYAFENFIISSPLYSKFLLTDTIDYTLKQVKLFLFCFIKACSTGCILPSNASSQARLAALYFKFEKVRLR